MDEREVWLTYAAVPGVGRRRLLSLMRFFPSAAAAWEAPEALLAAVPGVSAETAANLVAARRRSQAGAVLERLDGIGGELVLFGSPRYPSLLAEIDDPPPYFFRLGPAPLSGPAVAIVGSRNATDYGLSQARRLAEGLALAGVTVISGLARGIDGYAHLGALDAGGRTVAVLGCGVDVVYPRQHSKIHAAIRESGALVSEYPPGANPEPWHFPERNRLISGLCLGVVVVEAGARSGALITADLALEQGREVLALPGPAFSRLSQGPHRLIQQGAALVQTAEEVLAAIRPGAPAGPGAALGEPSPAGGAARPPDGAAAAPPAGSPLGPDEAAVYGWLGPATRSPSELANALGLPAQRVAVALTLLELRGLIRSLPGGQVMRT